MKIHFFVATISCCDTVDIDTSTYNGHGGTGTSSIFSLKRTQNNDQVSDFVSAHSAEIDLSDLSTIRETLAQKWSYRIEGTYLDMFSG